MRLKLEKGMTPERIAQTFVDFVRMNKLVIGVVNVYIQTYDENMKAEKDKGDEWTICKPSELLKEEYANDVALIRRGRLKAVNE